MNLPEDIKDDAELVGLLERVRATHAAAVDVNHAYDFAWAEWSATDKEIDALMARAAEGDAGEEVIRAIGVAYRRRLRIDVGAAGRRLGAARDAYTEAVNAVWKHMAKYMPKFDG